jgi:hypothetical protein
VAAQLAASQEGLSSVSKLFTFDLIRMSGFPWRSKDHSNGKSYMIKDFTVLSQNVRGITHKVDGVSIQISKTMKI